ncbi:MAG: hypothetical protein ACRD6B_21180 [Bryobacteraceae bacterium]
MQSDSKDSQLAESVELSGLADSIVISVDPDAQVVVNAVSRIDYTVAVAAVHWVIEQCKRSVAITTAAPRLRRHVAEKLGEIVDLSVSITIESEPPIPKVEIGPTLCHAAPSETRAKISILPSAFTAAEGPSVKRLRITSVGSERNNEPMTGAVSEATQLLLRQYSQYEVKPMSN